MDHVGGLTKVSTRSGIAAGGYMHDAGEIVAFLQEKFRWKTDPMSLRKLMKIDWKLLELRVV